MFYILCGLPFSGKTTLANLLKKHYGFSIASTDDKKMEHGYPRDHYVWIPEAKWQEILSQTYKMILDNLKQRRDVVFDYTNSLKSERENCIELAKQTNSDYQILWITTSKDLARKRYYENKQTKQRHDIAEEFFEKALQIVEPPIGEKHVLQLDGTKNPEDWIKEIIMKKNTLPHYVKPKGVIWKFLPFPKNLAHTLYPNIYVPELVYNNLLSDKPLSQYQAILLHEQEHLHQQKNGGSMWFIKYMLNKNFRLQEELKAYKMQQEFLRKYKQDLDIPKIAKLLSGVTYLWCTTFNNAKKKLEE